MAQRADRACRAIRRAVVRSAVGGVRAEADVARQVDLGRDAQAAANPAGEEPAIRPAVDVAAGGAVELARPVVRRAGYTTDALEPALSAQRRPTAHLEV